MTSIRTLKDDNELLHWTQTATLEALVEVAGALLQEQEAGAAAGADDGALFEALYETYVDLVEGATAGGRSSSSGSTSSDASFRDRRRQLVPRAGALLVGAYRRLQEGQEQSSLEAALAHGHRVYPEKQGQAKVSKAVSRKRGRPSSSAAAATALAPAGEGASGPSSSTAAAVADESGPGGKGKRQRVVEEEKEGGLRTDHGEEEEDDDGGASQPDAEGFLIRVDDIAVDGDED